MSYRNRDIAACGHATCPSRENCLRWQLGQRMSDYQWWANFKPTNGGCKYFMYHNPNDNDEND